MLLMLLMLLRFPPTRASRRLSQSRLTNLAYVTPALAYGASVARLVVPKQSPLNWVKINKLEVTSLPKALLATTLPTLRKPYVQVSPVYPCPSHASADSRSLNNWKTKPRLRQIVSKNPKCSRCSRRTTSAILILKGTPSFTNDLGRS